MNTLLITNENKSQYINTKVVFDGNIRISASLGWLIFVSLSATGYILAEAGTGIKVGLSIAAKWISSPLRIFAGLVLHRLPTPGELEIRAEVRSGVVAHGTVVKKS
jgi:hypothetical protein